MVRGEDQSGFQFGIECPEEELHALMSDRLCVHRLLWWEHTREWCPKEVAIVRFKTPPDADVVGEVFRKLYHERREGLALSTGEMECVIRQGTLSFGEKLREVCGDFDERSFAASKPALGSMGTKIHGGTSPLALCCNVDVRALSMCQRHGVSLRLFRRWIWRNRTCLMASRFSGCACSSARLSKRSWTSPRSSKS